MVTSGQALQRGFRGRQIADARSRIAQLSLAGVLHWTTLLASCWRYGSYRMSASFLGPKTLSSTRAILTSSKGPGSLWQRSSTAFAIYCPTLGKDSISSRVLGNLPFLFASSRARRKREYALLFQSPSGLRNEPSSFSVANASFFHEGYL